jgi:cell shape-determining protein MreD
MNRIAYLILQILLLLVLFVIDKSSTGIYRLFDIFSFTVLYLMVLLHLRSSRSFITTFFVFGFLVDWYNKSFLGISSMVSIFVLFVYNIVVRRFAGNKLTMFLLNYVTAYILFQVWLGFESVASLPAFLFALFSTAITSYFWLQE